METVIKQTTRDEYDVIAKEVRGRFDFTTIRRNKQQYAMGGFSLNPKDYEKGFSAKQIDALCVFLKSLGFDTQAQEVSNEDVYGAEHGKFAGTKQKYFVLKDGMHFLVKLEVL